MTAVPTDEIANRLSKSSVRCIMRDNQGGMWAGTYFDGLFYYNERKGRFISLNNTPGRNSISNNVVACITEAANGNLWIGTNGGLNHYSRQGVFKAYTTANGLPSNDIKSVYVDNTSGKLYIGSQLGALSILNPATGKVSVISLGSMGDESNYVYAMLPFHDGKHLFLGTLNGLRIFDKETGKIDIVPSAHGRIPQRVRSLAFDRQGRLWIGGEDGMAACTFAGGLLHPTAIKGVGAKLLHTTVYALSHTHDGILLAATTEGLLCVDTRTMNTKLLTTHEGLPSNFVYGALEDRNGTLWISTDYGLCSYRRPKTHEVRHYETADGIKNSQFMPNAFCLTKDGDMFFGGTNGITVFNPEQFKINPYTPKPIITGLRVLDRNIAPSEDGILRTSIETASNISVAHNESTLEIRFAVPNYVSGSNNIFAYRLNGYEDKWHLTTSMRTATYVHLPHGKYTFQLRAANNDGNWSSDIAELTITVRPAWFQTWLVRIVFVLIAAAMIVMVFRYVFRLKAHKLREEQEKREQRHREEVNEMKLRFFIDISHELRTPLTLIASPLEELEDYTADKWTKGRLGLIRGNVNRLLQLVNQLLDYRKAEMGAFQLLVRHIDLQALIMHVSQMYSEAAKRRHILLKTDAGDGTDNVLCDPNYMELILNNLLSNAFKYTDDGKSITVSAAVDKGLLTLKVADTGHGIPKDKQQNVFKRFYQVEGGHMGSGIGLSIVQKLVELHHGAVSLESEEGVGTTFTITLPTTLNAYSKDELASHQNEIIESMSRMRPLTETVEAQEPMPEEEASQKGCSNDTVMIVEDNDDIRHYISGALSDRYSVIEAANGREALDKFDGAEVSLVITDVMMPVMDGLQLCRNIKRNILTSHLPVIILSAKVDIQEQLEGLQVGADDYIPKPFSINVLTAKVKNILHMRDVTILHYGQSSKIEPEKLTSNPLDEDFLKRAVSIVESHLDDADFSTDKFAREMLMSRSNLHLKMKALTGESTNEFIKHIRFGKACQMLREGWLTVAEISYRVGFNSPSYFATSFKKKFGCMPTEYAQGREPEGARRP